MIIRFRGKEGMFRVSAEATQSFEHITELLRAQLPSTDGELRFASAPNKPVSGFDGTWRKTIVELGLKHGDMLFFEIVGSSSASEPAASVSKPPSPQMLLVDEQLSRKTGKITRQRSKLCRHDERGMCEYCKPLEPFDEQYRIDHAIKHLSLWAEIRRQKEQGGRLEQPFFGVKKCKKHAPFPESICSACQPQPVTLQLQKFRVVDHVEFASSLVINNVVDYWRQTNTQRFGFMIGEYKEYDAVPLGQKAVVHAIWEPQQQDALDGLAIGEEVPASVEKAASALGLAVVGVLWTDIVDAGNGDGTVLCKRHPKSYFMASQEVLFSANLQNKFPNTVNGARFSSKFVTCIISGNLEGQIDVACYQMGVAAESLVESNLVEASANPAVVRVKPRTATHYVPEVHYKQIDQYGNTVAKSAKPSFPTDFLLVSLSHGFSEAKAKETLVNRFPIENRPTLRTQTTSQLAEQLDLAGGFDSDNMADFHLLVYLFNMQLLNPQEDQLLVNLLKLERDSGDQNEVVNIATQLAYSDGMSTLRAMVQ